MNGMVLVRAALLVTTVSMGIAACGDDDAANNPGKPGGAGGAAGSDGSGGSINPRAGSSSSPGGDGAGGAAAPALGGQAGTGNEAVSGAGGSSGEGGNASGAGAGGEGGAPLAGGGAAGADGAGGAAFDCTMTESFGTLADLNGDASVNGTEGALLYSAALPNADLTSDLLHLELYPGLGAFPNDLTTLTNHVISGDDLNYGTCGLCLLLYGDVDDQGAQTASYFVTAGTVTLTSVAGRLTGTLKNATFQQVTINTDTFETTPVPGGCTTSITSLPFDAEIVQ